jgi:hypothetical protein
MVRRSLRNSANLMKKALAISVLLNLVLAACFVSSLTRQDPNSAPRAAETGQMETPVPQVEAAGDLSQSAEFSRATEIRSDSKPNRLKVKPATMPLVFQDADLGQLNLNSDQLQAIDGLRQRFLDEIGKPNDPEYRERWMKSQPDIDNDLRGMIGVAAFQNLQVEAFKVAEKSR